MVEESRRKKRRNHWCLRLFTKTKAEATAGYGEAEPTTTTTTTTLHGLRQKREQIN